MQTAGKVAIALVVILLVVFVALYAKAKPQYVGCYKDQPPPRRAMTRLLPGYVVAPERCAAEAERLGYKYVGYQDAQAGLVQCSASNDFAHATRNGVATPANCPGGAGTAWHNAIYEV